MRETGMFKARSGWALGELLVRNFNSVFTLSSQEQLLQPARSFKAPGIAAKFLNAATERGSDWERRIWDLR